MGMLNRWTQALYFQGLPWLNGPLNTWEHKRWTLRYLPRSIYIETTNYCNAHCIMCPHDKMKRARGHMDMDLFRKIVDDAAAFEGRGLNLFLHKDGEPLMDPMLFERIRYAKEKLPRSRVHFNTNAALLDDEKAEQILASPLDSMVCSIDGATKATYERIRVGLDYDRVTANVRALLERKRARGSRLHVILQMVADRDNLAEAEAYRRLWAATADKVVIKPMHNFLVQGTALKGGEVGSRQQARCTMPFRVMLIYCDGDVGLCCWDYDRIMPLGDVRTRSLEEAFNSDAFDKVREAMRRMDCRAIRPCNVCSQIFGQDGPMWR